MVLLGTMKGGRGFTGNDEGRERGYIENYEGREGWSLTGVSLYYSEVIHT